MFLIPLGRGCGAFLLKPSNTNRPVQTTLNAEAWLQRQKQQRAAALQKSQRFAAERFVLAAPGLGRKAANSWSAGKVLITLAFSSQPRRAMVTP